MEYCQICCSDEIKGIMVDYLLCSTYGETNLDEDPCLVPDCGHLMTMSSMDGSFGLADNYEINGDGEILSLKSSSLPFSIQGLKTCPICRGPLRNINRYSRIIRRSAIDEATKKFISWSNEEIIKHADMLHIIQGRLSENQDVDQIDEDTDRGRALNHDLGKPSDKMKLAGHRSQVMADISRIKCLKSRYRKPYQAKRKLQIFLDKVKEEEQPFGRLWDLLQDRRRRDVSGRSANDLVYEPSVIQLNAYLMSKSLSIKFDLTIIADALAIRRNMRGLGARYDWGAVDLEVDFSRLREECLALADQLATHQQYRLEVETRLSFSHLAALERYTIVSALQIDRYIRLGEHGSQQLNNARQIHERFPGQTTGVSEELEAVEQMLRDGTFYSVMTSEEKRAVYAAMSNEFSGTGHWYTCERGHPFTVGECGMPTQQTCCPQCGSSIGGHDHVSAQGVRRLDDLEAAMGNMGLGDEA
jgi:hypothetical protein